MYLTLDIIILDFRYKYLNFQCTIYIYIVYSIHMCIFYVFKYLHLKIKIIRMSKGVRVQTLVLVPHTNRVIRHEREQRVDIEREKKKRKKRERIFPIGWIALFLAAIIVATPSETTVVTRRVAVGIPHRRSSRSPLPLLPFSRLFAAWWITRFSVVAEILSLFTYFPIPVPFFLPRSLFLLACRSSQPRLRYFFQFLATILAVSSLQPASFHSHVIHLYRQNEKRNSVRAISNGREANAVRPKSRLSGLLVRGKDLFPSLSFLLSLSSSLTRFRSIWVTESGSVTR